MESNRERWTDIILSFVAGTLVSLVVVAFILLTGSPPWRRVLTPVLGALVSGYLLIHSHSGVFPR